MDRGIVKYNEGFLLDLKRHLVKEVRNLICIDRLLSHESFVLISTGNHPEDIQSGRFLRRNEDIFILELPSVRYITGGAYVALICIIEINFSSRIKIFKFLQLLFLVFIELRRGTSPWAFSYSLISCANADKKRLKVDSLASLPTAFCQASRALFTL